jgi:hypothetical protein
MLALLEIHPSLVSEFKLHLLDAFGNLPLVKYLDDGFVRKESLVLGVKPDLDLGMQFYIWVSK